MNGFIKLRGQVGPAIFLQPGVAGVADNLRQPGARVDSVKPRDESKSSHQGFLGHVFGVGTAAQQPARQVKGGILMRHNQSLKALTISRLQHVRTPSLRYRLPRWSSYSHSWALAYRTRISDAGGQGPPRGYFSANKRLIPAKAKKSVDDWALE